MKCAWHNIFHYALADNENAIKTNDIFQPLHVFKIFYGYLHDNSTSDRKECAEINLDTRNPLYSFLQAPLLFIRSLYSYYVLNGWPPKSLCQLNLCNNDNVYHKIWKSLFQFSFYTQWQINFIYLLLQRLGTMLEMLKKKVIIIWLVLWSFLNLGQHR